jgi:hypothetical protein
MFEQSPSGDRVDAQHAGLHLVDLRRKFGKMMLRRSEMLRPAARTEQRDDYIAFGQGDNGLTDLLDLATAFVAGNAWRVRGATVVALNEIKVRRIHGSEPHAHAYIVAGEWGQSTFMKLQNFGGIAGLVELEKAG